MRAILDDRNTGLHADVAVLTTLKVAKYGKVMASNQGETNFHAKLRNV